MNNIILSLILSFVIQAGFFIPAHIKKINKYSDLSYALSFAIIALIMLVTNVVVLGKLILFLMIGTWSIRLISKLNKKSKNLKKELKFWIFQTLAIWIILLPSSFYFDVNSALFNWLSIFGIALLLMGILIEKFAIHKKLSFKNKKLNHLDFWNYSEHPIYFGEILCWLGIYFYVLVSLSNIEAFVALISPIFIMVLVTHVKGTPKFKSK